jgi:hypothetical protein
LLQLLASGPDLRNLLLGVLMVGFVCKVVFWSSPRNLSSSNTFKKARLGALAIVGLLVLGAAIYLAHRQLQLRTLLWLGAWSTLAAVGLFFATLSSAKMDGKPEDIMRASSIFLFYAIAIGCAVASLSVVAITVGTNPLNSAGAIGIVSTRRYEAEIHLDGTSVLHENRQSSFTSSSGQMNFGCEQTVSGQATFPLPDNATLVGQPLASWRNIANAIPVSAAAGLQGNVVVATGTITGIPYENFPFGIKNCTGGGHGELVLSGQYQTDDVREVSAPPQSLASTVSSSSSKEDWVTLPASQEFKIREIDIAIKDEVGTVASRFALTPSNPVQSDGKFSAIYSPQRQNGQLLIRVQ